MGLSWSNTRRRTTTFYHPPPPPPPCCYHHHAEPISLLPPPPPPHQSHYTTMHQPPPLQSYPPPNNPYPTHIPPLVHHYCNSHHYHSCNYANHQPFYYTCQHQPTGGWSPVIRPHVGFTSTINAATAQPILPEPAPFVDHQNAKRVRNDVNVNKDTLKVEIDVSNPDHHLVSFVFDALFDGSITIFYFAKEEQDGRFVPAFPEAHLPVKISFQKGLGQKFHQPPGTGIDLGFFELDDLSKSSPEEDVFPLVIAAETYLPVNLTNENDDSVPNTFRHMQITQAVLERKNGDNFHVRVIRQILWVAGVRYELHEIYGIGSSAAEGFDDSDPGKDCVICMAEPKDTAVLPCRHMCMCGKCANELRLQSNKCPICRQPIEQLIGIKINSSDQ
ncbi:PREDICTED: probable E3 ubiquitin-protein ligase LUL4 [Populus euphratica]|uniref:RING-type E3 ubiquitin transferase n=1 Tax=Populus euphratica TaxID=75702 RepID=A0AAJ6XBM7_POPEU|nr:PREDICTED: probable E3 ubiquitin-protein ligase LUL4 [Populus euphratica]